MPSVARGKNHDIDKFLLLVIKLLFNIYSVLGTMPGQNSWLEDIEVSPKLFLKRQYVWMRNVYRTACGYTQ